MVDKNVVRFEDAIGEPVVVHEPPDIFLRVEFGAFRRQGDEGDVGWHNEALRHVPTSLIEQEHGVGTGATALAIGERGANRLGVVAVLPLLSVRPARRCARCARGSRAAGPFRQPVGSGDRSHELGFRQDHDQHPDDLGDRERHGHPTAVDAAANGEKLA